VKYITIATDISNSGKKHQITTWACYIRHHKGTIKVVRKFNDYYKNTHLAETHALMNALVIAEKNIKDFHESKIIIYNEVPWVLDPIRTKSGNIKKKDLDRAKAIQDIAIPILQRAVSYERRKVIAHLENWQELAEHKRYAINHWCDEESRKLMQQLRAESKKNSM